MGITEFPDLTKMIHEENYLEIKKEPAFFHHLGTRKYLSSGDIWILYDHWVGQMGEGAEIWIKEKYG